MPGIEHAVIAAAGFGSRLGRGHPKCLVEFRGATLLQRQLRLLADVPDVRIVVGFEEHAVVAAARAERADIIIVRNPGFATNTTLDSYALGARHLTEPCLFMDADIVFEPQSFDAFVTAAAGRAPVIAYTAAKTADAVYVQIDEEAAHLFSRTDVTPYEWANLAILPPAYCESGSGSVYGRMSGDLPLPALPVVSFEIDRPEDLAFALEHCPQLPDDADELIDAVTAQGQVVTGLSRVASSSGVR